MRHPRECYEAILNEILEEKISSSRGRQNPRAVKRKMKGWPIKPRQTKSRIVNFDEAINILSEQY